MSGQNGGAVLAGVGAGMVITLAGGTLTAMLGAALAAPALAAAGTVVTLLAAVAGGLAVGRYVTVRAQAEALVLSWMDHAAAPPAHMIDGWGRPVAPRPVPRPRMPIMAGPRAAY